MITLRTLTVAALLMTLSSPAWAGEGDFSLRQIPETAWEAGSPGDDLEWLDQEAGGYEGAPSMQRAVLYSLVLPGWGDYYAGRKQRARYFFISEAAIWTSFAVFRIQGNRDEDAYQEFATRFAGVERTGHSDDFYAELREWDSSAEYEAFIKTNGRPELFPDIGYFALENYFDTNRVADFEPWEWESFDRRLQFAELRSASKAAFRRSMFSVAAAGVNRLVAAIFAYQAVKSYQNGMDEAQTGWRLHIDPTPPARYDAALSVVHTF